MFSVCQFLCDHLKSHMPSRGNMVIKTWLLIINWIMAYWSIPFFYLNTMSGTTQGTVESTDCKAEFSSRFTDKSRLTPPHRALPDTYIWLKILKIITGVRVQQALKNHGCWFPFSIVRLLEGIALGNPLCVQARLGLHEGTGGVQGHRLRVLRGTTPRNPWVQLQFHPCVIT